MDTAVEFTTEPLGASQVRLIANTMRHDIIRMLEASGSGHPDGSLSAADIMATLFFSGVLNYDHKSPNDHSLDRFFLSKGHAAPVPLCNVS